MSEVPIVYKDKVLILMEVRSNSNDFQTFFLTKNFEFIEINKNQEIVNYIKFDVIQKSDNVKLKVFERLDFTLIFLIQLNDDLYVVQRNGAGIKLIRTFCDIVSLKIEGQSSNQTDPVVLITLQDGSTERTSFNEEVCNKQVFENNVELFRTIDANLKYQKTCMTKTLKKILSEQQLIMYSLLGNQKFLPLHMRFDDPNDVSPLVKFGNIFSRVCNDKLVIGIPVFNSSSLESPYPVEVVKHVPVDRPVPVPTPVRLLLENLKLITYCPTLSNAVYSYDLYKMKTDCPSFEEFEKLFKEQYEMEDGDIKIPESPEFKAEWNRCCEKSILYACQAGIFVMTADIVQFVNDMSHTIGFNISYEIKGRRMNSNLIVNVGQFMIDSKIIYSTSLDINQFDLEKYRNLLAITSTSQLAATVDIFFEKNERIENFLVKNLNFHIIKSQEDVGLENPSSYFENPITKTVSLRLQKDYFLFSSDGYFKGTLIRARLENDGLMKAKIYVRVSHQIIVLLQMIYKQYPRHCKIQLVKIF